MAQADSHDTTTNVVEFPSVEIEWTQDKIDEVHGRAFRDLEKSIFDCATMSMIALHLAEQAERAIEGREPADPRAPWQRQAADHAMFAVFHLADMLKKLKADYEGAWYAEKAVQS